MAKSRPDTWGTAARAVLRVVSLRESREELRDVGHRHLLLGLALAWLAGIGRHWDDPRAVFLQRLSVGSVVYVVALSLLLWGLVAPFRPPDWSYRRVLVFVSFTSPPAFLYAIPVERWMSMAGAAQVNVWFLAIVASWRVILLFRYLARFAGLSMGHIAVVGLLPLVSIVTALTMLNLQHVVFRIMGGLRDEDRSPHDDAYAILFMLTWLSIWTVIPLLLTYLGLVVKSLLDRRKKAAGGTESSPRLPGVFTFG